MNPLFQMLGGNNASPIKNIISAIKNPQAYVQSQMQSNPQVAQLIRQNGGDAKQAFYNLANQMGIDPNEVLKNIRM